MCTVTYFHTGKSRILTSSRDEKTSCLPSAEPEVVVCGSRRLFFSRDSRSGGTWFISDDHKRVAVLLNGAFQKHEVRPAYRKSRGLVLIDLFIAEPFVPGFEAYNLTDIEPFQVIYTDHHGLCRLVWDGKMKHYFELAPHLSHIFSSVTLYDEAASTLREQWYSEFIKTNKNISREDLFNFHLHHQKENPVNGLRIHREDQHKTHNISQVEISPEGGLYTYLDLAKKIPKEQWISRAQPI
jgi:hypothetical protein